MFKNADGYKLIGYTILELWSEKIRSLNLFTVKTVDYKLGLIIFTDKT